MVSICNFCRAKMLDIICAWPQMMQEWWREQLHWPYTVSLQ